MSQTAELQGQSSALDPLKYVKPKHELYQDWLGVLRERLQFLEGSESYDEAVQEFGGNITKDLVERVMREDSDVMSASLFLEFCARLGIVLEDHYEFQGELDDIEKALWHKDMIAHRAGGGCGTGKPGQDSPDYKENTLLDVKAYILFRALERL